ncbi:MAG: NnrS family protein [Dechloromonas sp.]|uniref:NnrS family protein n=1 Tax=Candidatus Dechloromonas phosphorivorans TaxID=2899244 RepID=A0A9D7QL92_9RHOO|nr:NnrS family protein [Candidatus Dechloromonas phosphorivorans]
MFARNHPLWLVGFRPFFALACLAGLSLPVAWILVFKGVLPAPQRFSPVQWHAHEMFFGFGWAVLGGFLLTASKNWVGVRGYHGGTLMFLAGAWIFERIGMSFGTGWPAALFLLSNNLFLLSIVALLLATLIRHRDQDSYRRDNVFFLIILPVFWVGKTLLLQPEHFHLGWSMTLGLFRVAFLVMLERTLGQFMRSAFSVEILRKPALDMAIKMLAALLIFGALLPAPVLTGLELILALLLLGRLAFWHPFKAFTRLELGIMILGYLAITAQLLIDALPPPGSLGWVGTVSVHAFTFGAMGLVIPAMMIRIANGHTGRKVIFGRFEKTVLWIMIAAFFLRLVGPQFLPGAYLRWLDLAATCWFVAFGLLAWRFIPQLAQARIDGREH